MAVRLYQYPKCGTCRKAIKWLDDRGVVYEAIDITQRPPSVAELGRLRARSGLPLRRFFNTSGESYRTGNFKVRLETMTDDEALAALAADGKLIKRPLIVTDTHVLVGFDAAEYTRAFA